MPFSSELGMNVYDPLQAYQSGQAAGRTAAQAYLDAPARQADQMKVQAMKDQMRERAKQMQLQELGIKQLEDDLDKKVPFRDAFFRAATKLYWGQPEKLVPIINADASLRADEAFRNVQMKHYQTMEDIARGKANPEDWKPSIELLPRPDSEEKVPVVRTGRNTYQLLEGKVTPGKQTAQQVERADFVKAQRQKEALEPLVKSNPSRSDLRDILNKANLTIAAWEAQHPGGQQFEMTMDAEGRPQQVRIGKGVVQPGAQSKFQTELGDLKNSIVQIDQIRNTLREKDVGIPGVVWDEIVNKWVAQIAPEAGDPSVSANRVQLQKSVDAYLQTQTAKGRLSVGEREDIRNALVSRKSGEQLDRARAVLDAMARVQKFDAITKAKTGRQPLEAWMFQGLSQTEIRQLMKEGVLTSDEALTWAKRAIKQ